jgi:signal transduction histidine kinase
MTFRTRLLLIFTVAVVAAVGLVEWVVSVTTIRAFESLEVQRAGDLVAQFRAEFQRRGDEIVREVNGIAASGAAVDIAMASDSSPNYDEYGEAASLAAAHGLGLLELVAGDGSIVSSAEWRARFGYKEDWIVSGAWRPGHAILRREELSDGFTLALSAVGIATAGDRKLYVVGGQQLDREFLSTLVLPAGMRVLLYRNLDPQFSPANLIESAAKLGPAQIALLRPFIERVRQDPREIGANVGSGAEAATLRALPLMGGANELLGILLISSSRSELLRLEKFLRWVGIVVGAGGMALGIALSWWATARVTRPVRKLAESAGKVAAGDWGTTVETTSADEIGQLALAFNRMTHEIVEQRERLVQAERVAAWRELARRLAHELKNPLFPLQITVENMQRARQSHPEQFDEVFREGAATLLAELANLKRIIGRFSDFAKMPAPEMRPVDFNRLAADALKLMEPQLARARVETRLELDPRLGPVRADAGQMTGVLRNLVLNAIDAMGNGGTLTVRTVALPAGMRLEVSDTGQGLTREECERLFTPYYTTKTHGTGLGLAIVQSVVSDHGGRISVESDPGKGTTFRMDLGA